MAKRKKIPPPHFEELMPLLIGIWRKLTLENGPLDRLQTREFRSVVETILELEKPFSTDLAANLNLGEWYEDRPLFGAYLLYYWILHYLEGRSLIGELAETPERVLDLSKGGAPFSLAALDLGASEVIAIERSSLGLKIGGEISGRLGHPLSLRKVSGKNSLRAYLSEIDQQLGNQPPFDLIIVGHLLSELFAMTAASFEQELIFMQFLMNRLSENGRLLLVESSHMPFNHRLLALRDKLKEQGHFIEAPCFFQGNCPALAAKSLCFAQRPLDKPYLLKELQRSAAIRLSSLKMSYLVVKKSATNHDLQKLGSKAIYRVVSPPLEGNHGKKYYLCGLGGKQQLENPLKTVPPEAKAFDYLQRGDAITIEKGVDYRHHIELQKETAVQVVAAAGKPVPNLSNYKDNLNY